MASSSISTTSRPPESPASLHRRVAQRASWPAFCATAFVALPVWTAAVLPATCAYQLARFAVAKLAAGNEKKKKTPSLESLDSGRTVDASELVPRQQRKYDLVVLGATGFAGSLAVRHLLKTYGGGAGSSKNKVKWAVAGRSKTKLDAVLTKVANELGIDVDAKDIDKIVVDTSDPTTLPDLVSQTKVVATTVGPFALYGNNVVEYCAKYGTHYVDITGEVDWVKVMKCKWQATAETNGAKLVSFCGHDCVPWDLCVAKFEDILNKECDGDTLKSASFWDEAKGGASGGTIATGTYWGRRYYYFCIPSMKRACDVCISKLSDSIRYIHVLFFEQFFPASKGRHNYRTLRTIRSRRLASDRNRAVSCKATSLL